MLSYLLLATGALLLLASGTRRMWRPAAVVWSGPLALAEVGVGAAGLITVLWGPGGGPVAAVLAGAQAALYAAFGAYLAWLRRTRPGAACGCAGVHGPAGPLALLRAGLLAAGAGAAGVVALVGEQVPGVQVAAALPLAGVLAAVLWVVPSAVAPRKATA